MCPKNDDLAPPKNAQEFFDDPRYAQDAQFFAQCVDEYHLRRESAAQKKREAEDAARPRPGLIHRFFFKGLK